MKKPSQDWIEDSTHWYGYVLEGEFAHWCNEFDGLPIDETCFEFMVCGCYNNTDQAKKAEKLKNKLRARYEDDAKEFLG